MADSSSLSYKEFHVEKETTLLFLHGGGAAGWMWQPVVDLLPDYHCLVPDLPEHGGSAQVTPFSMELAARKADELIKTRAHGGKAVIVGLSEGAQVAVQVLAIDPHLVEGALISSALLLPMPGGKLYSAQKMISAMFRMSVPPFRNNDGWIRLNMKYAAGIPDEYFTHFKKDFQEMTESQFVNLMMANQTFRLPEGLGRVDAPVMIVCGKHEYAAMKKSAQLLAGRLGTNQVYWIDLGKGSGMAGEHNWALTAPRVFASAVLAWLARKPLPEELIQSL